MQLHYTCWTSRKPYQLLINKQNVLFPKQHNVGLVGNEDENFSVDK